MTCVTRKNKRLNPLSDLCTATDRRRSTGTRVLPTRPFGSFESTVWIDSIGVPDEYKTRNQMAAGFETVFFWPVNNKNVDWINYLYYNHQRFINSASDALEGLAEQIAPTCLLTRQNRLRLAILVTGDTWRTLIAKNTA